MLNCSLTLDMRVQQKLMKGENQLAIWKFNKKIFDILLFFIKL